jgi:hypothetical protein
MLGIEIFYGIAVRYHISPETHFLAESGSQPIIASLDGNAVVVVIGTHHAQ